MGRQAARLDPHRLARWPRPLRRAERRQFRKRLGRLWGLEWRSLGRLAKRGGRYVLPDDPLTRLIVGRGRELGHVAKRLREGQ